MEIAIVGVGYVGLVSGACFSELGARVHCVDTDKRKIEQLKDGQVPIYEPGLEDLVVRNTQAGRLSFSSCLEDVLPHVQLVFIAVGTPPRADGGVNLDYVLEVAHTIGSQLNQYVVVVNKSTVPVGTAERVRSVIALQQQKRGVDIPFDVASNPEFLKEGDAIDDFMKPDRVVVGVDSERAKSLLTQLYRPMLLNNFRVIFMDIASAEMTKYAANAMLATRISFMNDVANLCERVGADVSMVRKGMGMDSRIGNKFLYPGCGYGGSCFPKDIQALIHTAKENGYEMSVLQAVEEVNNRQKNILFEKFFTYFKGNIAGLKVAVWGLSFKPGTDDMREAPSLVLIDSLLKAGCSVVVYDPVAMNNAATLLSDSVAYAQNIYDSVVGVHAIFHVTEWKEFRMPNWIQILSLVSNALLIDGRNVFGKGQLPDGFDYLCIGEKTDR